MLFFIASYIKHSNWIYPVRIFILQKTVCYGFVGFYKIRPLKWRKFRKGVINHRDCTLLTLPLGWLLCMHEEADASNLGRHYFPLTIPMQGDQWYGWSLMAVCAYLYSPAGASYRKHRWLQYIRPRLPGHAWPFVRPSQWRWVQT